MNSDFENQLRQLRPAEPSPALKARIRAALPPAARRDGSRAFWNLLLELGAAGIVAAALVSLVIHEQSPSPSSPVATRTTPAAIHAPDPAYTVYREIPLQTVSCIVRDSNGMPQQMTSTYSLVSHTVTDPRSHVTTTVNLPRQRVILSRLDIQ